MKEESAHAVAGGIPATGRVLGGRYRVGKIIRSGGMGSVYEGEHTATGRRVALKLVHLRAPVMSELEHRFEREARIASNVQSKHVVQVFDAGRDEVLGPFIVMELLEGEDLEERLVRTGALPPRIACEIAFQAARGLEKAHAANVAHRDLKPGNIFLVDSDEDELLVKVLDFGIAKLVDDLEANAKLTRAGTALGTPQYMSPEQARGQVDIDARTDVYSLGAVLYEMIVGESHVPELANYNQLVIHIATELAPRVSTSVPSIDPRIDRLVADMLLSDRRDRLQTMRQVRQRLAPILGSAVRAGSTSDASGSFAAGRLLPDETRLAPDGTRLASTLGASSARIHVAAPVAHDSPADSDSEEVHFFERESSSSLPVPGPAGPVDAPADERPDSYAGEKVELFERASLHLPASVDRSSSSAHIIDDPAEAWLGEDSSRGPAPDQDLRRSSEIEVDDQSAEALGDDTEVALQPPPLLQAMNSLPATAQTRTRSDTDRPAAATPRRTLLAAIVAAAIFVTLGSVQIVRSTSAGSAGAPPSASHDAPEPSARATEVATTSPPAASAEGAAAPDASVAPALPTPPP